MRYNSLALGLAAVAPFALAQTKSECNPTKGERCAPDPAFGKCRTQQTFDFTTVAEGEGWKKDSKFNELWKPDGGVMGSNSPLSIDKAKGATFTITKDDQAPLIKSKKYIFFGKIEVDVEAAPGQGIVTSIVLESDDLDEIDWEWVGADQTNVQTNFFSKGVNEFIHGKTHPVSFNAMEGLHTYSVEWTPDFMVFSVDGNEVRRATPAEAENGKKWPQTPTMIKLGTWVGGRPDGAEGTIEWAGGVVKMEEAPFVGHYKEIRVTDYCGGMDKAGSYVYSDASGSMESIKVDGKVVEQDDDDKDDSDDKDDADDDSKDDSDDSKDKDEDGESDDSSTAVSKPTTAETSTDDSEAPEETGGAGADSADLDTDSEASTGDTPPGSAAVGVHASSAFAGLVFLGFLLFA